MRHRHASFTDPRRARNQEDGKHKLRPRQSGPCVAVLNCWSGSEDFFHPVPEQRPMSQTIFEKIIAGEIPCAKVFEDDRVFAFMDAGQVNPGHVIVAAREPFETLLDADETTAAA